ncbi:hypothetical protein Dda_0908 [Drechslerella dactyloides]|uniref:Uncharacterized protein n=1 Tax=Drechslerella dactyloides TaxID=74499 RepID=A0AAD6NNF2_DREDA|nr:hypothetical protein Dda_0908 [Drechslerella dactyloides]
MATAEGSLFARSAALEVDDTSIRSTPFRCFVKNPSHCPNACGWEYILDTVSREMPPSRG